MRGAFDIRSRGRLGRHVPLAVVGAALPLLPLAAIGPNAGLAVASVLVLAVGTLMLWRPGEPQVLLLCFSLAWVGAATPILHANWLGIELGRFPAVTRELPAAIGLALAGVVALGLGLRIGAGRWQPDIGQRAMQAAVAVPRRVWLMLYAVAAIVGLAARAAAVQQPGLAQPLHATADLRWALYFALAVATWAGEHQRRSYLAIAFAAELAMGLSGYFSDFRTVFLMTVLALSAAAPRLGGRALAGCVALGGALVAVLLVWTAVKDEYRRAASGGVAAQIVTGEYLERMTVLAELAAGLDQAALGDAASQLLERLAYVAYLGAALEHVPAVEPHTHGAIMLDALWRPLTPRLLFPEKPEIDDTERTNRFTGGAAGESAATSISLGYIAECYIDFGVWGMLPAVAMIGVLYGGVYRLLLASAAPLLGMGLAARLLLDVGLLENSFTKVLGGLAVGLLAAAVALRCLVPLLAPRRATKARRRGVRQ